MGNRLGTVAIRRWAAALLVAGIGVVGSVSAAPVSGQGTWETTLQARDINGDSTVDAYYDTALNLTWLANWNANGSKITWSNAVTWAAGLDVYGVTGWRLPGITDTGAAGCDYGFNGTDCGWNADTSGSELAHMFYVTLGNLSHCTPGDTSCTVSGVPQPGSGLTNTGNFLNMQPYGYWYGTEYAPNTNEAWNFWNNHGFQGYGSKDFTVYAVAVHSGDVAAAISEPETCAMLLAGLGLLGFMGHRRKEIGTATS